MTNTLTLAELEVLPRDSEAWKTFAKLEVALDCRMHQFYMYTMCEFSRELVHEKASSVTAGWDFKKAYGQAAFDAWCDEWYEQDVPDCSKPAADRAPLKRPLLIDLDADEEEETGERPCKIQRVDPATIIDRELKRGIRCGRCFGAIKTREGAYYDADPNSSRHVMCERCALAHEKLERDRKTRKK